MFFIDTLRFYQALRMCGTDFALISNVFPNRSRDDIKRKFKTEDKANRTLVDSALRKTLTVEIFQFKSQHHLGQHIPFDLTCFYSPSENSSDEDDEIDTDNIQQKKLRKRRKLRQKNVCFCVRFFLSKFISINFLDFVIRSIRNQSTSRKTFTSEFVEFYFYQ